MKKVGKRCISAWIVVCLINKKLKMKLLLKIKNGRLINLDDLQQNYKIEHISILFKYWNELII